MSLFHCFHKSNVKDNAIYSISSNYSMLYVFVLKKNAQKLGNTKRRQTQNGKLIKTTKSKIYSIFLIYDQLQFV